MAKADSWHQDLRFTPLPKEKTSAADAGDSAVAGEKRKAEGEANGAESKKTKS